MKAGLSSTNTSSNSEITLLAVRSKSYPGDYLSSTENTTQISPSIHCGYNSTEETTTRLSPTLLSQTDPAPKLGVIKRAKYNSTETMFVRNILLAPDIDQIVYCLARAILLKLRENVKIPEEDRFYISSFDERKKHLFSKFDEALPDFRTVLRFLTKMFTARNVSAECGVMAVAYVDRLFFETGITFDKSNWRSILFISILTASKILEDIDVWNADYAYIFHGLTVESINCLERVFLCKINYHLTLTSSEYTKYYFELRSLANVSTDTFPVKPLDKRFAAELEARCTGAEEQIKKVYLHNSRCNSLDSFEAWKTTTTIEDFRALINRSVQ